VVFGAAQLDIVRGVGAFLPLDRFDVRRQRDLSLGIRDIVFVNVVIVTDEEALQTAKDLARLEGLMCGISSGTNVAAALKMAKKLGKGKTVVTILPDTAERYFSTALFE
jgi:cysteine synthase